jgi:hypothetical protein
VERKHRHLDRKRREEREEQPQLQVRWKTGLCEGSKVECAPCVLNEDDYPDQHEDASRQREQHELHCGVHPVRASPDTDEEEHRDQHELPIDKKEKQIQRHEDTDHRRLHDENRQIKILDPAVDRTPRDCHAEHAEQSRQHHEQDADSVDTNRVINAPGGDPWVSLDELHMVGRLVEIGEERQRQDQRRDRCQ